MPGISISLNPETIAKLQDKAISPSKIAQQGIDIVLELGGVSAVNKMQTAIQESKDRMEIKDLRIEDLKKQLNDLKYKYTRKLIELTMPDLHRSILNKEKVELDIMEIRATTGEKLGMTDLAEAYDNIDFLDYSAAKEDK
jgi:hypothetical protein